MNTSWTKFGLGVFAVTALAGGASAQKPSYAERGLVGVNLYDSGVKVVSLYGSPDSIEAVSISGGTQTGGGGGGFGGPGFGGPGGGRPPGAPPGYGGGRGPSGGAAGAGADRMSPFDFGDDLLRQQPLTGAPVPGAGAPAGGGRGGFGPPGGLSPGGPPAPGGAGPSGGGQTTVTQYTRWIYTRGASKYGFIVDNQGRVVQIEAIGLQNNRVKTRKGVGFGATFAQLIKSYGNPDGYEVGGDTILVKYLVNKKVAFRLTRLQAKKPYVVTGIVVSAGKV